MKLVRLERTNEGEKINEIVYVDHDHEYKSTLSFTFYFLRRRNWICNIDQWTIICSWRFMILFESIVFRCFFLVVQIWSLFTFSFWFCLVLELNVADNVWSMVLMHLYEKKIRFWEVDRLEEYNLLICFNSQYRNFTRIFLRLSLRFNKKKRWIVRFRIGRKRS